MYDIRIYTNSNKTSHLRKQTVSQTIRVFMMMCELYARHLCKQKCLKLYVFNEFVRFVSTASGSILEHIDHICASINVSNHVGPAPVSAKFRPGPWPRPRSGPGPRFGPDPSEPALSRPPRGSIPGPARPQPAPAPTPNLHRPTPVLPGCRLESPPIPDPSSSHLA